MKTTMKLLGVIILTTLLFSCDKDLKLPKEDVDPATVKGDHVRVKIGEQKWSYQLSPTSPATRRQIDGGIYYSDVAFDEEDNLYLIINRKKLISLDKKGRLRWRKTFQVEKQDRIVYYENRLFIFDDANGESPKWASALRCFDPETGDFKWKHDISYEYDDLNSIFGVGNNKVYVITSESAPLFVVYDLDGNELWKTTKREWDKRMKGLYATENPYLKVRKDKITITYGPLIWDGKMSDEYGNSRYLDICYQDNGNSLDSIWVIDRYAQDNLYKSTLIPGVGDTFYCFFKIQKDNKQYPERPTFDYLWQTYDANGQKIKEVQLPKNSNLDYDKMWYSNLYPHHTMLFTKNEEFYNIYENKLFKIDREGNEIWNIPGEEYENDINNKSGHLLAQNGNIYFIQEDTLRCANANGKIIWKAANSGTPNISSEEKHFAGMNHKGDLIVVDQKAVYCYRGLGDQLDLEGWPRVYYDYGNTAFKP